MKDKTITIQSRDRLVKDLTPEECGALLVHAHVITPERRRALLFKRGPASAYFSKAECQEIREWIENETWLPTNSEQAEHPKLPTHWCNFCGHVLRCQHDRGASINFVRVVVSPFVKREIIYAI